MNNFWQRAITGTIFVVVLVGAIVLGGWYMHVTFGVIVSLGLYEFYSLFNTSETKPQKIVGTILGSAAYLLLIIGFYERSAVAFSGALIISSFAIFGIIELTRTEKKPFENIAVSFAGVFYITIPFILLTMDSAKSINMGEWTQEYNFWPVLSIFILIWANDTFAYLTGRLFGKHKLLERISPKKTWEGFIGGVLFAVLAGVLLAYFLNDSYLKYIIYGLIAGILGTAGDLFESMLKRSVGVKDSGNILPGHGGILDRFDAVLFVAPVIVILENSIFRSL
jgi:phosphatidate cytidylyltransferase